MTSYIKLLLSPLIFYLQRKNEYNDRILFLAIVYSSVFLVFSYNSKCKDIQCVNGECINGTCVCKEGWQGSACQHCEGKIRLNSTSGFITDGAGNYSTDMKCSWLVDAGFDNSTITFHVEEFCTECGWDYLYIYDGDSVQAPILAVYSGFIKSDTYRIRRIPEVVSSSRYALIYFFSDVAINMSGFNISYRINSCPSRESWQNCSGNGICMDDGICTCNAFVSGNACHIPICPNNCTNRNGMCNREFHRCDCESKYSGDDCNQIVDQGYWQVIQPDFMPEGSSSHTATVWRDSMYIISGESYGKAKMIYVYDFNGNVWETPHMDSKNVPSPRYGHSSVLFGDKIYIYGGMVGAYITNEIWAFDVNAKAWENITVKTNPCDRNTSSMCGPLNSVGHTATLYTNSKKAEIMIVIFGYSPIFGFLNTVQEYHLGTREWSVIKTYGFPVKGTYGHSSAWDSYTKRIYVSGGLTSTSSASTQISNFLYSYEPDRKQWSMLMAAPSSRYLHSASFINGMMLVFGGNVYNGTTRNAIIKCYSRDFLAYDVICNTWSMFDVPELLKADLARFGHSAVTFEQSIYIYGGFDGQMHNDILKYTVGNCSSISDHYECLNSKIGIKCIWDVHKSKCLKLTDISRSLMLTESDNSPSFLKCGEQSNTDMAVTTMLCGGLSDCHSCVNAPSLHCGWCSYQGICTNNNSRCKEPVANSSGFVTVESIKSMWQCNTVQSYICQYQHTCSACIQYPQCYWNITLCVPAPPVIPDDSQDISPCLPNCYEFNTCSNCTEYACLWCFSEGRCVDKPNGYLTSYPYGQCREWTTTSTKCRPTTGNTTCGFYKTCKECREDVECGWCDDGSGTGVGICIAGGSSSPSACTADNWYFTSCPTCQCNGHSVCGNDTNICSQPCNNNTQGMHCEKCVNGYFGKALNGGICKPCECNKHATFCHLDSGKCFCTTKGIIGDHCDKCDSQNNYHGNPIAKPFTCFYELTIDYQFTFNLSKKEDRHYRQINFKSSPPKTDVDAEFAITCSVAAKMNITMKTGGNSEERSIVSNMNCSSFKTKLSRTDFNFGLEDNATLTTFYVYVYDFHPPLWIQISFSQYLKLNLQQFFLTFSSCFLLLLLVAGILWKLKQKYDAYRRRQRIVMEMVKMAKRPFPKINLLLENKEESNNAASDDNEIIINKKKKYPIPVAMEPLTGERATVMTVLISLPTGDGLYPPNGQPGLAIGSALVTVANNSPLKSIPAEVPVRLEIKCKSKKRMQVANQGSD